MIVMLRNSSDSKISDRDNNVETSFDAVLSESKEQSNKKKLAQMKINDIH